MDKEESNKYSIKKEVVPAGTNDFESKIFSVLERDGAVLSTPRGLKKRAFHRKPQIAKKDRAAVFRSTITSNVEDNVECLDMESVACVVKRHESPEECLVSIKRKNHNRSPFVISLRECVLAPEHTVQERVHLADQTAYHDSLAANKNGSYQSLSEAALRSKVAPVDLRSQANKPSAWSVMALNGRLLARGAGRIARKFKRFFIKEAEYIDRQQKIIIPKLEREYAEAAEEVVSGKSFSYGKTAVGFLVLIFLITLPAQALVVYRGMTDEKGEFESQGREAVESLSGLQAMDLNVSLQQLHQASAKFKEADRLLDESRFLAVGAAAVVPKQYRSARSLLEVGNKMSQAGQLLAMGFGKVFDDPDRSLMERLEVMRTYSLGALPLLTDAQNAAQKIDISSIPEEQKENAKLLPDKIGQAKESVRELAIITEALTAFLGKNESRNYLLIFQNQTELRPTGGFMGSLAEISLENGRITSIKVPKGGPYDLKGQLMARVLPPKPLQLINYLWQFQDANWFPDFYKTALKIRWFWSKSGQPTIDGVIAVNSGFMEKILEVTGPVSLPEYNKVITAENFLLETQKAVELEYDKEANTPKKFIGDLFEVLMERSKGFDANQWLSLASADSQALETKDIQIAMFRPEEEELVERFGWQGKLKSAAGDSLAVIGANIAGQKTDGVVKEVVDHVAEIQTDGSIIDTFRLTRVHQGVKGELFRGVRNVQYLRIYVPKGSEILAAQGFDPPATDLYKEVLETDRPDADLLVIENTSKPAMNSVWTADEDDRTVFGGWLQLDPGQTQEIIVRYKLPFTVYDIMDRVQESAGQSVEQRTRGAYLMLLTSQSGKVRDLNHEVRLAAPWQTIWTRGQIGSSSQQASAGWKGVWDRDQAVASLLSRNTEHEQER